MFPSRYFNFRCQLPICVPFVEWFQIGNRQWKSAMYSPYNATNGSISLPREDVTRSSATSNSPNVTTASERVRGRDAK